ncbi:aspartate--tRNA ligase [Pelodictyon luteolum]|uniref:Aspartate--tRNA(Asp/Asn) ligase n=1 Tax=Chlorobium luteolum (strain DSM 273 / BCRC 81028 / 2530) TaxID=319225 RepID=SYDND_CHLL3|nr:aspartate--tRNA ligase [Pelodictyon luteolum]Q3B3A1.1 RecName: Full=Aspartate--tRNA(Asp/Asn) ligase; AltName: Full=Aspartyl-tRNA synthetase; Short=AspRS; AltName: Full=Non-discriminating aspartyl-tRNA synthetase; Short=ND-AspRS [Pelodictyon luteolum DSM 273]ABB24180.1 aspartyl-tRNA synthetase [Pelodictyon luteolum DSM 273]
MTKEAGELNALKNRFRTDYCGQLGLDGEGREVRLGGWVHRIRDHGGLVFIDLRDHTGICQLVVQPEREELFELAGRLHAESVITIEGRVVARSSETINPRLASGSIEVVVSAIGVESHARPLPFPVADEVQTSEELRLKYRFIDLRREKIHENIIFRSRISAAIRRYLEERDFIEIQTPILTSSSPEGARDFLVPSRLHPGKFYALPQAPQQFKQLLMVAGFPRYFQIAPCFRDEDARADRSPGEFYQLDMEMAFIEQDDLFEILEGMFRHLTDTMSKKRITRFPFPRISYREVMDSYGTDKPDLRIPLKIEDVTPMFTDSGFKVFASNTKPGCAVKALVLKGRGTESRLFYDKAEKRARELGSAGLAYIQFREEGPKGPIVKFMTEPELQAMKDQLTLETGDVVFFAAGKWEAACKIMGGMRTYFGDLFTLDPDELSFCWIVDFPMFEYNEDAKKVDFSHNPFSMPQGEMEALETMDPLDVLAYQYDIVCNGIELSSGAIRNHKPEIMYKAFEIAGYSREEVDLRFGHMIEAFKLGAPPHGGIAPGLDRLVMILRDEQNIREVIAFPMNQQAQDLMMAAPSEVTGAQLRELHIRLDLPEEEKK